MVAVNGHTICILEEIKVELCQIRAALESKDLEALGLNKYLNLLEVINQKIDHEMDGRKLMQRIYEASLNSPYAQVKETPLSAMNNA